MEPDETVKPFNTERVCPALKVTFAPFTVQLQADKLPVELKVPAKKTRFSVPSFKSGGPLGLVQIAPFQFLVETVKVTVEVLEQPKALDPVAVIVAVLDVFTYIIAVFVPGT
jgi:hypothetical protein